MRGPIGPVPRIAACTTCTVWCSPLLPRKTFAEAKCKATKLQHHHIMAQQCARGSQPGRQNAQATAAVRPLLSEVRKCSEGLVLGR